MLFMAKNPAVLDCDLSSIKVAVCGAAPLPAEVSKEFLKRTKVAKAKQSRVNNVIYNETVLNKTINHPTSVWNDRMHGNMSTPP
jgi:hypothetical protein